SCHTGTHGVTCGRPSARTVESQNSSAVSSTRRVSSHGVTPPRGTPCRVSSVVMGSFILRTPFNRSVSLAGSENVPVHSLCMKENWKGQKRRDASKGQIGHPDHVWCLCLFS